MEAYLDNAATTRVFPEVRDIMLQVMEKDFGNPSSRHTKGIEAEGYVTKAVQQIAGTLKCQPKEIILTSGGTESNNMALIGTALANQRAGKHVITTRIEHASIHEPFGRLEQMGYEAQYLPVDHNGHLQPEMLEEAVREDTLLVSVMMVNNEMGAVEDIKKLVAVAKQKNPNVIFHVDAIQAYGKYKIVPKRLGIDLMSVSGHKIHAPKGIGALYIREGLRLAPYIMGGAQEGGRRAGTEAMPAIAAFGAAAEAAKKAMPECTARMAAMKKDIIAKLSAGIPELTYVDTPAPHILSISLPGWRSEVLMNVLEAQEIYVSKSSACKKGGRSHVLEAIGLPSKVIDGALRIGLSRFNTDEDVDALCAALIAARSTLAHR